MPTDVRLHRPVLGTLKLRIHHDIFVLSSAVSECARTGPWNQALGMLWQLRGEALNEVAYNAVIGACTPHRWQLASQLLYGSGKFSLEIKVDVITFTSAVKTCPLAWQKALLHLQGAQQRQVKTDIILLSAVSSCVKWKQALNILYWPLGFERPTDPDSFASSLIMKTLMAQKAWQQANAVLSEHRMQRWTPQTTSLNMALEGLGHAHLWQEGIVSMVNLLHEEMITTGFQLDIAVHNTLISLLGRQWLWTTAQQLMDKLHQTGAKTNQVTYNAVMAAHKGEIWEQAVYLLSQRDSWLDLLSFNTAMGCTWPIACHLLSDLPLRRLRADSTSRSRCINACAVDAAWCQALQILEVANAVTPGSGSDLIAVTAAANACGRASQVVKAENLLRAEERRSTADVVLFNTVMSAFGSLGRWQEVHALLRRLQHLGLQSQIVSCNAAISSCDRGQRWQQSHVILQELKSCRIPCTSVTFNAVVSSCAEEGEWKASFVLVEEMQQQLQANSVTYNTAIKACVPGSMWEQAVAYTKALHRLHIRLGTQADAISCSSFIASCSESNQWRSVWLLLEDFWQKQVRINDVIAGSIGGLEYGHQYLAAYGWRETSLMLDVLSTRQAEANVLTLSCVVVACEKGHEQKQLLQGLQAMGLLCLESLESEKVTRFCVYIV